MKLSPLILLLLFTISCKESITQNGTVPTADAGFDQTIHLGSYALLDGSRSTSNNGKLPYFVWRASSSNPANDDFRNYTKSTKVPVSKTGIYKYYLQVHNGESYSVTDSVTINVLPRIEGIIEDELVEQKVRISIEKQTGQLTPGDLSGVESLYLSNKIYTLNGIEHCVNLKNLTVTAGAILDLSCLSNLSKLEILTLISQINFTGWDAFKKLTSTTSLHIYVNDTIDLTILENMSQLEDLIISSYSALRGTETLSKLKKIKSLNLSSNKLEEIFFVTELNNLQVLYLSNNLIKDISPIINLKNLQYADFSSNEIEDISSLESNFYVKVLYLAGNKIKNIKPLYSNNSLGSSQSIHLNGNPLDSISVNFYIPELRKRGVNIGY